MSNFLTIIFISIGFKQLVLKTNIFAMTSYGDRQDVMKNMFAVHGFYLEVLRQYSERLQQLHFKSTRITLSEQQIHTLIQATKHFLNNQLFLFKQCIVKRQTTIASNILTFPKKLFLNIQNRNIRFEDTSRSCTTPTLEQGSTNLRRAMQEKRATLEMAHRGQDWESTDAPSQPSTQRKTKRQQNEESSDNDSDPNGDFVERAESLTNAIFLGRFTTAHIKRKPKEQKIFLELDDVFVKYCENGRDAYYDRAHFELTKVQKSQAKLPLVCTDKIRSAK